jgi:SOS-response transcriptional repressor LexA
MIMPFAIQPKTQRLQNIRLRDNLLFLMKQHKTNMTLIFKQTGVPITTIQRICKDPQANPTLASLIPIAEFFSITLAQLIGEDPLPHQQAAANTERLIQVPVISWQQAIHWPRAQYTHHQSRYVTTELNLSDHAFALDIEDDYLDSFHRGTKLIVDSTTEPNHGDYVISHKKASPIASLNQILKHEADTYLKPTNPDFKTTLMDEHYRLIGVVVQARMNLK